MNTRLASCAWKTCRKADQRLSPSIQRFTIPGRVRIAPAHPRGQRRERSTPQTAMASWGTTNRTEADDECGQPDHREQDAHPGRHHDVTSSGTRGSSRRFRIIATSTRNGVVTYRVTQTMNEICPEWNLPQCRKVDDGQQRGEHAALPGIRSARCASGWDARPARRTRCRRGMRCRGTSPSAAA